MESMQNAWLLPRDVKGFQSPNFAASTDHNAGMIAKLHDKAAPSTKSNSSEVSPITYRLYRVINYPER